jgi:hypothetical protein
MLHGLDSQDVSNTKPSKLDELSDEDFIKRLTKLRPTSYESRQAAGISKGSVLGRVTENAAARDQSKRSFKPLSSPKHALKAAQTKPIRHELAVVALLDKFWLSALEEIGAHRLDRLGGSRIYERIERAGLSMSTNDTQKFNVSNHADLLRAMLLSKKPVYLAREDFGDAVFGFAVFCAWNKDGTKIKNIAHAQDVKRRLVTELLGSLHGEVFRSQLAEASQSTSHNDFNKYKPPVLKADSSAEEEGADNSSSSSSSSSTEEVFNDHAAEARANAHGLSSWEDIVNRPVIRKQRKETDLARRIRESQSRIRESREGEGGKDSTHTCTEQSAPHSHTDTHQEQPLVSQQTSLLGQDTVGALQAMAPVDSVWGGGSGGGQVSSAPDEKLKERQLPAAPPAPSATLSTANPTLSAQGGAFGTAPRFTPA